MRKTLALMILALVSSLPQAANAGMYTDDLAKCLVESTTSQERISLVRWIFTAISRHPAVSSFTTITDADIDKANAATGNLFMKLLTETCLDASKKAIKYEGMAAVQVSFQVLGQVAMGDLMADSSVTGVIAGLDQYMDEDKLNALKEE